MAEVNNPRWDKRRIKSSIALWLTFIAGFVDIAGVITIYDIFSAHMTGTTVRLGEHLVQRDWKALGITAIVLASFVAGSLLGRVLIEMAARAGFRSVASVTLSCEAALLLCAIAFIPAQKPSGFEATVKPLIMLAAAMGFQTATLTRVGPLTVHTTFVTGMLNKLSQLISHWIFRTYDIRHATEQHLQQVQASRQQIGKQARFIFSIWLLYVLGAVGGTAGAVRWQQRSFLIPFCMLLVAVGTDLGSPLSVEEEREQSER